MAGRTAVALQIVHRRLANFDFFIPRDFSTKIIIPKLTALEEFELFDKAGNTINGSLNGIKISFFPYNYNHLRALIVYNKMAIASKLDIALMKREAIAVRESKKAFFDLYFLLKYYKLIDLFGQHPKKYGKNLACICYLMKSLVYFDDAEQTEMLILLLKNKLEKVKKNCN